MICMRKSTWLATTALIGGLCLASGAQAQSTGSQAVEGIIVTAASGPASTDGLAVAQVEPKSRASITQEFIGTQAPGQTILQSLNLLPGVNFTNNDPYGSAGGDIVLRGFDSQRVALLQDGVPLNDSGNYAIYPNQQLEPDLIERTTVNLGTTDVDSPTAAAAGGTVNYITRRPSSEMGGRVQFGYGTERYHRYYGVLETGEFGPWGTKAWVSGLYTRNDIFKPHDAGVHAPGKITKRQFNAYIRQDIGDRNFIALIANYNSNRNNFINRISLAQFNARSATPVYNRFCVLPVAGPGAQTDACANYVGHNLNPSNTGNLRGLSSWALTDTITLTVDPSFQYVLANGGGAQVFPENDPQFRGNVDLNSDGDFLDRVFLYRPNTTNTRRYGITSSLIWRINPDHSLRAAYTFDKAKHRQTGEFGFVTRLGDPENVFGGKEGYGDPVLLPDGTQGRRRDRYSLALLNQFAVEYRGRFVEDRLLINAGLRAPFFKRKLNQFCYQRDTFNAYCTTQMPMGIPGTNDGNGLQLVTFPVSSVNGSAANRYGQPRRFEREYDKLLPNAGVSFDLTDDLSVYASYAQTLSAPRTDDLYDRVLVDPGPETATAVDAGVRYQTPVFSISGAVFMNRFKNRIERVFDEPAGIAFSANVGDVHLWGIDGEIGWKPLSTLGFYASASYIHSEIQDDIRGTGLGQVLLTKGKSLYETPEFQFGGRVNWEPVEFLRLGAQVKHVGDRWSNLVNTEKFPGYTLVDADVRLLLDTWGLERTYIQLNMLNLFDERFLGDMSVNLTGTGLAQPGYRRSGTITLHYEF